MKFILSLILCLTLATGCSTTPNPVRVAQTASVVKGTVRSVTFYAIHKDSNSKAYLAAVGAALSVMIGGDSYAPSAFQSALSNATVNELKTIEAQIALNLIMSLYEVNWAGSVSGKIENNEYMRAYLTAIRDGIAQGLADAQ